MNRKLSANFTLKEFINSPTATAKGIDNTPSEENIKNLAYLVENLLQPLRDNIGKSLTINSGYRSRLLNSAVGGVVSSQHLKGEAADVGYCEPKKLLGALVSSRLLFDQAILYPTFLHLSLKRSGENRKRVILK